MIRRQRIPEPCSNPIFPLLPRMLKDIPNWVIWRLTEAGDKPLFIVGSQRYASSTDPSTWVDFSTASKSPISAVEGLGFVIGGDALKKQLVGVDIDGCRNPDTEELTPWSRQIISLLDSYCEVTPSKMGVRIWIRGEWPFKEHVFNLNPAAGYGDKVKIEVYNTGRYFTVTGDSLQPNKVDIERRDLTDTYSLCKQIQSLHPPIAKKTTSAIGEGAKIQHAGTVITSKLELLMKGAIQSTHPFVINDGKGNSLEYPSPSEADMALCTQLALKHGDNADLIFADYEVSSLYREKWGNRSDDFKTNTISKAIATATRMNARPQVEPPVVSDVEIVEDNSSPYAMTSEEILFQENEAEYPVYKLKETAGPSFDPQNLYGIVGEATKRVCEFSEANVGAVYLNLLVSLGNVIGRGAYFKVGPTKHFTNENVACVGSSSVGRKGSSSDGCEPILHKVDGVWMANRNPGGFATPQAVLSQINDDSTFEKFDKKTETYHTVQKPGVADKRLCIREGEISNVFKMMSDPKMKAAELVRNLWDGKMVSNMVAGQTEVGEHKTLMCREPHVSIVGSTTQSLAKATLPVGADKSGDGNRFLWCYTKRTQLSPTGGPDIEWDNETVSNLAVAVYEARKPRLIGLSAPANSFWKKLYLRLENDQRAGFLGGMTSRSGAHIRRLAMILALLDKQYTIGVEHLKAAEAIWDFSQESARFIFQGYSVEQERILDLAQTKPEGILLTDIHNLFSRNKTSGWIKAQLQSLVEGGFLTAPGDLYKFKKR